MRRRAALVAAAVVLAAPIRAPAGEWECKSGQQYHLDRRAAERESASAEQRAWAKLLADRLTVQGGQVSAVDLFVPTKGTLSLNDAPAPCQLYQAADAEPQIFLVVCESNHFWIDFASRHMVALGGAGLSVHASPTGAVAALVHSTGTQVEGVPLTSCFFPPFLNPWFRAREVWWS